MTQQTTPLRESDSTAAPGAEIIDAKFTVVAVRKRGWVRRGLMFLFALACAAAIGFLIPPAWVVLQELAGLFG